MSLILGWLAANIGTILVCTLLLAMVVGLIYGLVRDKKKGKSCCGGCSGCSMQGVCHHASSKEQGDTAQK